MQEVPQTDVVVPDQSLPVDIDFRILSVDVMWLYLYLQMLEMLMVTGDERIIARLKLNQKLAQWFSWVHVLVVYMFTCLVFNKIMMMICDQLREEMDELLQQICE